MNRSALARAGAGAVALVSLFVIGCGAESTTTVAGTVTFKGAPVRGGAVILYCPDKQIVRGTIDRDGRYSIPNVPFGSVGVTVLSPGQFPPGMKLRQPVPPSTGGPVVMAPDQTSALTVKFPLRYEHPEESGLSVVVDRGPITFDIDLKP